MIKLLIVNKRSQHGEREKMHISEITGKANSKKEMYRILQLEGDVHLPPIAQANHEYVSGILTGTKKVQPLN